MVEPGLSERQRQVLQAVIYDYILMAEPVGSRVVSKRYSLGLSPATIRNTMADLEEQGYLNQPHTSAGRVPTDKAYRYYVDYLGGAGRTPRPAGEERRGPMVTQRDELGKFMGEISYQLSALCHYTGVVLAPPLKYTILARIDFLPLDRSRVLVVLVTDSGWVTSKTISVEHEFTEEGLREISRYLTQCFRGKTVDQLNHELENAETMADGQDRFWILAAELRSKALALAQDCNLYIGCASNILDYPEFSDLATMRALLRAFEEKSALVELLTLTAELEGVQVLIGRENPYAEFQDTSIVAAAYKFGDRVLGTLGVVGPRRMPYERVVDLVEATAREVSDCVTSMGRSGQVTLE